MDKDKIALLTEPMSGLTIRGFRKKLNMTQTEFAELVGIVQPHLSAIERGRNLGQQYMFVILRLLQEAEARNALIVQLEAKVEKMEASDAA